MAIDYSYYRNIKINDCGNVHYNIIFYVKFYVVVATNIAFVNHKAQADTTWSDKL